MKSFNCTRKFAEVIRQFTAQRISTILAHAVILNVRLRKIV